MCHPVVQHTDLFVTEQDCWSSVGWLSMENIQMNCMSYKQVDGNGNGSNHDHQNHQQHTRVQDWDIRSL